MVRIHLWDIEASYNEGFMAGSGGEDRDPNYSPASDAFAYDAGFSDGTRPERMLQSDRQVAIRRLYDAQLK